MDYDTDRTDEVLPAGPLPRNVPTSSEFMDIVNDDKLVLSKGSWTLNGQLDKMMVGNPNVIRWLNEVNQEQGETFFEGEPDLYTNGWLLYGLFELSKPLPADGSYLLAGIQTNKGNTTRVAYVENSLDGIVYKTYNDEPNIYTMQDE